MNIDMMASILETRVPTAIEFHEFVKSQGWNIRIRDDGKAALVANAEDPVAVKLAKMMGREPWRTEILKIANGSTKAAPLEIAKDTESYAARIRGNPRNATATQAA